MTNGTVMCMTNTILERLYGAFGGDSTNRVNKRVPAPICEGQVAGGRRCKRRTRSPDGLCGVCKGKQQKRERRAARGKPTRRASVDGNTPTGMFLLVGHNYSSVLAQIYRASNSDLDETLRALEPTLGNRSAHTGAEFTGLNRFYLAGRAYQKGFGSNRWATVGQWRKLGGRPRPSGEGTRIMVHNPSPVEGADAYPTFVTVYNQDEIVFRGDGPPDPPPPSTDRNDGSYEELVNVAEKNLGVRFRSGVEAPDRPGVFYPEGHNRIALDDPALARSEHERKLQLLHELIHWTRSRRSVQTGSETEEELVAVFGTALAASRLRIPFEGDPGRGHAKHLVGVLDGLQPEALMKTSSLASQSVKYLTAKGVLPDPFPDHT